ncbi:MAG: hypothetical protein GX857_03420 [Bacteroidales bacterium]|nr:hypothetical protein [Bacteroidales bacterium]
MIIKRYFSTLNLKRVKDDFKFLVKLINSSYGEFDFAIRDNSFNIYYKGNSLAKVEPKKNDTYSVKIHKKFFDESKANNPTYYSSKKTTANYIVVVLNKKQLRPFFQRVHLNNFASLIKKVNYGEEINFEQMLITDNQNRSDFIYIDRQVNIKGKMLDLLALKQVSGNKFKFLTIEVKLGNNPDLKDYVASQLDGYVNHIKDHFDEYKYCYEKQFEQKRELGLLEELMFNTIEIVNPVEGVVVVGGYSGLAKQNIKILKDSYPDIDVIHFTHEI